MRKRIMSGLAAGVLLSSFVSAAPAAASAPPAPQACSTWIDSAGPGGAGRYHAKCAGSGKYVKATVWCANGSSSSSQWRWEYAKAECPYGVKARSGTYSLRS
ncbi:hypothetical protein LUX12_21515 [Streptomyces somaliensis]|uniref:hypothetical protein n=1 Tax=Streptomyces somaliensis TaxID=78355 RepID=UPI0020CC8038|nr:hypothetical protein [Streptomyces somaliensis]MCP9946790.1 hypothetical protein [Streptomyces somaliensis]